MTLRRKKMLLYERRHWKSTERNDTATGTGYGMVGMIRGKGSDTLHGENDKAKKRFL